MKNNGIGLGSVFLVLFVTLKLLGKIDWSWWWVLSPIWISAALFVVVVIALIIWEIVE